MGCCLGKGGDELPPAFDPVIGLSEKLKGPSVLVERGSISGSGSVMGDSPVLQDKAFFEATIHSAGRFAIGVATRDAPLDDVLSQDKVRAAAKRETQRWERPAVRPPPRTQATNRLHTA